MLTPGFQGAVIKMLSLKRSEEDPARLTYGSSMTPFGLQSRKM